MGIKSLFTMALATGLAVAKPINTPAELPAYPMSRRQGNAVQNGFGGHGFNFIDGFNRFNDQPQVVQVKQESLQIQNNGFQQQVVQQVNEVLVVNQQQNGFNNDLNNLFRKANFRRERNQESTVMLVVQQIQVSVADDRGNAFQQDVFVQSAIVANRGARTTNTVMRMCFLFRPAQRRPTNAPQSSSPRPSSQRKSSAVAVAATASAASQASATGAEPMLPSSPPRLRTCSSSARAPPGLLSRRTRRRLSAPFGRPSLRICRRLTRTLLITRPTTGRRSR
ncbi:hypothetical protein PMIN03_004130 [Paraphaeosphaeria minitans]